ncbi:EcoKI restriction-modification system protein HsdS [compost metagenome]
MSPIKPTRLIDAGIQVLDCEHKTPPPVSAGFPYIAIPDIQNGRINTSKSRLISAEDLKLWTRRHKPQGGDILVTRRGRVGDTAPVPSDLECAIGQNLVLLRSTNENVDQDYLRWAVRSPQWWAEVERLTNVGAVFSSLNVRDIGQIRLIFPDLYIQRAIAKVLGALDDKIAANVKLAEMLTEVAMAKFKACAKSSHRSVPLSDLVTTQYGITTSSHDGPGPQFLRVTDINKKPWIEWETAPYCTVSEPELAKYKVHPGDILVARMADPGKAAYVDPGDPEAVFASYLVRLRALDSRLALFIYYYLRSDVYKKYTEGAIQGSVQKNMNAKVIVASDISMPEPEMLSKFNEVVTKIRAQIQSVLKQNLKLSETRDTLLPHLMSGKLRVKDAESLVEFVV